MKDDNYIHRMEMLERLEKANERERLKEKAKPKISKEKIFIEQSGEFRQARREMIKECRGNPHLFGWGSPDWE